MSHFLSDYSHCRHARLLPLLALVALTILSACATSGSQSTTSAGPAEAIDLNGAVPTGDDWLDQARTARGARADSLYLNAAQAYLAERRFQALRDSLAAVSQPLNRQEQTQRYAQLRAAWHLSENNAALARDWLATLAPPRRRARGSDAEADDYWLLRAAICEQQDDWPCVAQGLINVRAADRYLSSPFLDVWLSQSMGERPTESAGLRASMVDEPPLTDTPAAPLTSPPAAADPEAARQLLNNAIWRALTRTRKSAAEAAAADAPPQERAWWDLRLRLAATEDRRDAAQQWKRQHGAHPASFPWPSAIARMLAGPNQQAAAAPSWPPDQQSGLRVPGPVDQPARPIEVAVLLPLSGRLAAAGTAVRDGFIAAQLGLSTPINARFYDVSAEPLTTVLDALAPSTQLIVGPLSKEQVEELARLETPIPRLALNYLPAESTTAGEGGAAPISDLDLRPNLQRFASASFYQLGIAIEDEAITLAKQLQAAGIERVLVVHGSANWAERAAETIAEQWPGYLRVEAFESVKTITQAVGRGMLIDDSHLRSQEMLRAIGEHIEFVPRGRQDLDAIVALISPTEAQALKPALRFHFASDLPVFTTSQVVRSTDPKNRQALAGAQLTELPGFIAPNQLQQAFNDAFGLPASRLAGLYALGADACRLSAHLSGINPAEGFAIDAATGALTLEPSGRFERELGWAMLTTDSVVPAPSVATAPGVAKTPRATATNGAQDETDLR